MKRNNKGFSLVELIAVLAIMAVALSVGGYALSTISLANAKSCAADIESTLEWARIESMKNVDGAETAIILNYDSAGNVMIASAKISYEADGNIVVDESSINQKKIANSSVTITHRATKNDTYQKLNTTGIIFSFNRSTGEFKEYGCQSMIVSGAGREFTITCYKNTGKIQVE